MAKIKKPNIGKDVEQSEVLYIIFGNIKWYNHFGQWSTDTPTLWSEIPLKYLLKINESTFQKYQQRDFPGGPVGKTPHCQCRGPRFDPWSGN